MASAWTYEQSKNILAVRRAERVAKCPLCGGTIRFQDASTLQHKAVLFKCRKCGARDDSDRQPDGT
jgi:predicted RNA-binding Zn-ribbon protein involved in translation (DUF1610 family)